jgi:ArsR family transcriptional regulator
MPTMLDIIEITESGTAGCTPLVREPLGQSDAEHLAGALKALADPARLRLLSIVASSRDQEACVCDLVAPVGLSQPTVSHHLKVLTNAGFLRRSKRGTWAYYRLQPAALTALAGLLAT